MTTPEYTAVPDGAAAFAVSGLSAGYGQHRVLHNVSFTVPAGSMTALLGANGSGKTTLLKAICGLVPHTGVCTLHGDVLSQLSARQLAARCGYIAQRSGITMDMKVLDVVLMGFNPHLRLLEQPSAQMKQTAVQLLEAVGLPGMGEADYLTLSEGQKQLCILARMLAGDGELLLLDEPESALDFRFRTQVLHSLRTLVHRRGRTALVCLHDPQLALNLCDRLLLLHGGSAADVLDPQKDTTGEMERKLYPIYGAVSLHRVTRRDGQTQLVMLKETDEA